MSAPPAPPAACQTCGKPPGEVSFYLNKSTQKFRATCNSCYNRRAALRAAEATSTKTCNVCGEDKTGADFSAARATCKPCFAAQEAAKAATRPEVDPAGVPLPVACIECGKGPGDVSFTFLKDKGTYRKLCKGCNNDRVKRTAAERSVEPRQCDTCSIVKPAADFEALRKTCKACRTANRAKASAAALVDKGKQRCDMPLPAACGECGLSSPQVNFKWRSDTHGGTYRNICCTCINKRGYSEDSRKRAMENDPVGYRARQNATHLAWTRANPDKVKAWQAMQATEPERKVKVVLAGVRHEMGEDAYAICAADKELLKAKFTMPCHWASGRRISPCVTPWEGSGSSVLGSSSSWPPEMLMFPAGQGGAAGSPRGAHDL